MNDKKKEVMTSQGRERTNIVRINQLVKDIETQNTNMKDVTGMAWAINLDFDFCKASQISVVNSV